MGLQTTIVRLLGRSLTPENAGRHWLALGGLLGAMCHALLFYFVPQPHYDPLLNLANFFVLLLMGVGIVWTRAYVPITHLGLVSTVGIMAYIVAVSGGVHSPAIAWITLLSAPPVLLLGRQRAKPWLWGIVLLGVGLLLAGQMGWINQRPDTSSESYFWALSNQALVLVCMMLIIKFYAHMQNRQMAVLNRQNAEIETTQQALQRAQSHKDEFIASVGHELRTPMNAILGLNDVLQNELQGLPEETRMAEHIREATEQLLRLVNDVLDLSQLEAGRLTLLPRPVELPTLLRRVLTPYEAKAQAKGVGLHLRIEPDVPAHMVLDAQRLQQVLCHLLDNAFKFTTAGHVELHVQRHQLGLRFGVQDSGTGIAAERQQQVFQRFEHADVQTHRAYGGSGLGLAICKLLVQLQGGQIGVKSQLGQGSLFWFDLPLHELPTPATKVRTGEPGADGLSTPCFLLVDDNPVNLMVARLLLHKNWPHAQVLEAGSAQLALDLLQHHRVDLVFMDMVMPVMDGLQATRCVRQSADPRVAQVPVVGLTANTQASDHALCLQAGMNDVLSKPLDALALREVAQRYVGTLDETENKP